MVSWFPPKNSPTSTSKLPWYCLEFPVWEHYSVLIMRKGFLWGQPDAICKDFPPLAPILVNLSVWQLKKNELMLTKK